MSKQKKPIVKKNAHVNPVRQSILDRTKRGVDSPSGAKFESFAGVDRKEIEKQFKTTITTVNVSYEELILSELTAIRQLLEKFDKFGMPIHETFASKFGLDRPE